MSGLWPYLCAKTRRWVVMVLCGSCFDFSLVNEMALVVGVPKIWLCKGQSPRMAHRQSSTAFTSVILRSVEQKKDNRGWRAGSSGGGRPRKTGSQTFIYAASGLICKLMGARGAEQEVQCKICHGTLQSDAALALQPGTVGITPRLSHRCDPG